MVSSVLINSALKNNVTVVQFDRLLQIETVAKMYVISLLCPVKKEGSFCQKCWTPFWDLGCLIFESFRSDSTWNLPTSHEVYTCI